MSGHNKWSKVKHKKAAVDARKSRAFSKLARLIAVESKKAGGDGNAPGVRTAVLKARSLNMPGDNIARALEKGKSGGIETADHVVYETYGPGGAALIILVLTDSKNRTNAEIKHILAQEGFSLATPGSALWAFTKEHDGWVAQISVDLHDTEGKLLEKLVELLEEHEDVQNVYTNAHYESTLD